jgi:ATP adenylyltransferase
VLRQAGIPFSVRVVSSLRHKEAARRRPSREGEDPFSPPDPELLVAGVSERYLAVLNRFPVLRHHLLLVTREDEDQAPPLGPADFDAAARCLDEIDGLAFYNSGPAAGASQPHRHLQLVPFPVGHPADPAGGEPPLPTPIEPALGPVLQDPGRATLPAYDFPHAVTPLPETAWQAADRDDRRRRVADAMRLAYRALAARTALGLKPGGADRPYNLLITRKWMLLVPRSRGAFEGIGVNALGFAGALLVKNREQLETVRRRGPLAVLAAVAAGARPTRGPGGGAPFSPRG